METRKDKMSDPAVIYAIKDGVATLILNRPDNKNALSAELVNALAAALADAEDDQSVRAIVLTNHGNTFCAGADLKATSNDKPLVTLVDLFRIMQGSKKPIVASVSGHCMGGGVGLAAACDLSVAAQDVLFGFTEVRIGVAPAIISVVCLPKMRRADAMELFLSGEKISAERAAQVGLINHSVPMQDLDAKVKEIAKKLVQGGPNALAASKQLVYQVPNDDADEAFAWTAELSAALFKSAEAKEGIAAFRSRQTAAWVPESESEKDA